MAAVIECTVGCSSSAHYRRAVACTTAFRAAAVSTQRVEAFNSFLSNLKTQYSSGRHAAVWQLLVAQGISLISNQEVNSSNITADMAKSFLLEERKVVVAEKVEVVEEEDDLFGIMA
jgi:hypothetical protein